VIRSRSIPGKPLDAAVTLLAVVASFLTVDALCLRFSIDAQPAIVAAIVAMSVARRPPRHAAIHPLAFPLVVAAVAPVSAAVGWLLRALPIVGTLAFVGGLFLSVWLRNFGPRARTVGALVALPLVAILAVPPPRHVGSGGPLVYLALVESASLIAFAYATVARKVFARLLTSGPAGEPPDERVRAPNAGFSPQTRMALQMAVALAAAFVAGFALFAQHWGWTVLTAFIVCSGARGRGDAAYRGVLRLAGALGGTLLAALVAHLAIPSGPPEAIAIFAMLYLGLWLRDVNYAYWACCVTLVLSLLSGDRTADASANAALLAVRLQAILVGAICGVAASWFVVPIRTTSVVRRRLADALRALDDLVAEGHDGTLRAARLAAFERRMHELRDVATPLRVHRRFVSRARRGEHPATWIDLAHDVGDGTLRASDRLVGARKSAVRRAIGDSRRAVANHGKSDAEIGIVLIGSALRDLRERVSEPSPGA
jgi:hypothetical protein